MATSHAICVLPHKNRVTSVPLFSHQGTGPFPCSNVRIFADGNRLTSEVCTAPRKQRLPVDFLCNHASKPHQQSLRFYSGFEGIATVSKL